MRSLNIKRIVYVLAFLALMGFSCYWTSESLYIWQHDIGRLGSWLIAIVFYLVASICFSMMLRALNKNEYFGDRLGRRGGQLALAVVGLLLFWIGMSLPTNTHTLLYKASVKNVALKDCEVTKGYLEALKNENARVSALQNDFAQKKRKVDGLLHRFNEQMNDPANIGIGEKCKSIFQELNIVLDGRMEELAVRSQSKSEWQRVLGHYTQQANDLMEKDHNAMNEQIKDIHRQVGSKELAQHIKDCNASLKDLRQMDGVDEDIIRQISKDLNGSYAFLKKNQKEITFRKGDKEKYTREIPQSDIDALQKVPDVWKDYLTTDKYDGYGFIWWVLIALLVDLAAFIFFDLAKRSKSDAL